MKLFSKKYRVSPSDLNELNPEETLSDSTSVHTKIEMPISRSVFSILFVLIIAVFGIYMFNIFQLQIVNGDKLAISAKNVNSAKYFSVPVRGIIYDDKGRPLVENVPTFDLVAVSNEITKQKEGVLQESAGELSAILDMTADEIVELYATNKSKPIFNIKTHLSREEVLKLQDVSVQGFYLVYDSTRRYVTGPNSAHILGYTSKVSQEDIDNDPYYKLTDRVGRYGLENQYEKYLRGERRSLLLGRESIGENSSKPGNDLYISANMDVQEHLYQAFLANNVQHGAAVVQNPKTGEILGLISIPSFDGNLFESGLDGEKVQRLLDNPSRPLFDRAIAGKYSPGSTVKPLLALAGLKEKVITPNTQINATGSIVVRSVYDPSVTYTFNDWKVHGITDVRKAISDSVDVYFYALGGGYENIKGLGAEKVTQYYKTFLLDKPTGIDLPGEVQGFIPTPEWKEDTRGEQWYIGDTYNISIGQGDLQLTPIAINSYIGSIANRGKIMKPYLVRKITDQDGNVLNEFQPQVASVIPFDQDTINVVREGMRQTITSGTATLLNSLPVPVAAKTGTAQTGSSRTSGLTSLFTVFGPYEDPEVSMTILVEGISGSSQGTAIRVANSFLSWYFGSQQQASISQQ